MASITELPNGRFRAQIRRRRLGRHEAIFDTRLQAQQWAEETESRLMREVLSLPPSALTFKAASELYQNSPVFSDKAPATRRREEACATAPLQHFGSEAMATISRARIQRFIDERTREKTFRKVKVSGDTVRLEKAYVSAVFRFCQRRGLVEHNPAIAELDMPRCNAREARITPAQEAALYDEAIDLCLRSKRANPNLATWLWVLFATGMRPGECAKIELSWLKLSDREIHIPRRSNKNRRPRVQLIDDETVSVIKQQVSNAVEAGSPYLCWSKSKKLGITPYRYSWVWRKLCRSAGIPDSVVPHIVRHETISRLFESTSLSDSQVAAVMGDLHVLSLTPYKHLRTGALRPHLDAHREAMTIKRKIAHGELAEDVKPVLPSNSPVDET